MPGTYAARIVEVPEHGIRLAPTADSTIPDVESDANLLALSIALALGGADYEHHPEPRNVEIQTIDALLAGEATMPWRAQAAGDGGPEHRVTCERSDAGRWRCRVHADEQR